MKTAEGGFPNKESDNPSVWYIRMQRDSEHDTTTTEVGSWAAGTRLWLLSLLFMHYQGGIEINLSKEKMLYIDMHLLFFCSLFPSQLHQNCIFVCFYFSKYIKTHPWQPHCPVGQIMNNLSLSELPYLHVCCNATETPAHLFSSSSHFSYYPVSTVFPEWHVKSMSSLTKSNKVCKL